jgi:aldehyde:ferredoxin oxidoreductase
LQEPILRKWVGGVGLGAKYLYDEVPPGIEWSDPENRLIWTTGPLAGSGVAGAATINFTAKGPMTNLAGASQANGFFGAYLKFAGFDGVIFQGKAPKPVYVVIREGQADIHDATHLAGMDMEAVENRLRAELTVKEKDISIFGIGPAGENLVRFACISGDHGHVAGHNGLGAVMGSKKLKAVVVYRCKSTIGYHDPNLLKQAAGALVEAAKNFGVIYQWGTGGGFSALHDTGALQLRIIPPICSRNTRR